MNDKQAHNKLKKLQSEVNSYRNSRREKNKRLEELNTGIREIQKVMSGKK